MTHNPQDNATNIDALIEQCQSGDVNAQIDAMRALRDAGADEAAPVICPLLASNDDQVRETAVHALERLGRKHVETVGLALETVISDPEWLIRSAAVEALGFLGHLPSRPALESVLRSDPQWEVRASAAEALGELGDPQALDALVAALDDELYPVRAYVAFAIGQLGDASQLPAIRRRLAVEDHPVPRSDLIVVALRFGDESALDDLLALVQEVDDHEWAVHVYSAINDLLKDRTPSVFARRADELEQRLAELGQRVGADDDSYVLELRQRLAALASSAAEK